MWPVRLATLPPSCAVVKKSGNLKFLEPSGPLQACNGTALSANDQESKTPPVMCRASLQSMDPTQTCVHVKHVAGLLQFITAG
jgi:hypothetical protein